MSKWNFAHYISKFLGGFMLKKLISVSGAILLVLFLFGCQEQFSTDPVEENSSESTLNKGGVLARANGSGHIEVNGELRVFTHNAKLKANGTSGHFNLNHHSAGIHFGGSVICLNVDGNTAYFAGEIETSNSENTAFDPGSFVVWSTIDNGEGNGNDPDQISLVSGNSGWTQADVEAICGDGPNAGFGYIDIEQGNIQVR